MGRLVSLQRLRRFIAISLLLVLFSVLIPPVYAETPQLAVSGYDLAPAMIFYNGSDTSALNNMTMLLVNLTVESGDVEVVQLIFQRTGQLADSDIVAVKLFEDANHNQVLDEDNDTFISSGEFELGKAELTVGRTISSQSFLDILVVLDLSTAMNYDGSVGLGIPNKDFVTTNYGVLINLEFPVASKNSSLFLDTDSDLNPDSTDSDDDNDGYLDDLEIRTGYDPKDPSSIPPDYDHDLVPDSIDTDDDNDGLPDKYDDFPKDKSRQRDFTIVILYAALAIFLILVMILVLRKKRPSLKSRLDLDEENEFAVDKKEIKRDLEESILKDDDDLLE